MQQASIETRYDFVAYLHQAARDQLIEQLKAIQEPQELGPAYAGLCATVVISSASYLECMINEYWTSVIKGDRYAQDLSNSEKKRFLAIASSIAWKQRHSILEKYELALSILDKPFFDRGGRCFQDAELLIALRNELIHFEPRSLRLIDGSRSGSTPNLEKRLAGKFRTNPDHPNFVQPFPHKCLNTECTVWAGKASQAFVDEFLVKIGAPLGQYAVFSSIDYR